MISSLLHPLLSQHGLTVYLIVGVLVFAEASVMFGFVLPGETAVILGGVLAGRHHASLWTLMAVVVVAAVTGDSVGYWVGQRFGPRLLGMRLLARRSRPIEVAKRFLNRRGGWAVFIGRFGALLRAVVPGLAGMSEMRYRTFLGANAAGALVWGVAFTALGYAVGGAYTEVEQISNWASYGLVAVVVIVIAVLATRGRRRARRLVSSGSAPP